MGPEDLKHKSWAINNGLTEQNKAMFDRASEARSGGAPSRRPMSAVTRMSTVSKMTNVPEVPKMKLMIIANDIYKHRPAIAEVLKKHKISLRNVITSSEIQQFLKKIGAFIDIAHVKALVREFGYNWNGPSCSFYDLFQSCKVFMYGSTAEEERSNIYY